MTEAERQRQLEIEAGADTLLYPGQGGIAIWVRRDDCQPRMALRFRAKDADPVELTMLLAALRVSLERAIAAVAQAAGGDAATLAEMVEHVMPVMREQLKTEIKQRPSSPHAHPAPPKENA